jgi:hypothetical protein
MSTAPLCQVIQEGANILSRAVVQLIFDMEHEIAHVLSQDDSIGFEVPQILS